MCGRFTLTVESIVIEERFGVYPHEYQPRFNIAPTQKCLVVLQNNSSRLARQMVWGLSLNNIPVINAKMETLQQKPMFRDNFKRQRCLVPADGFFEWKKATSGKIPYRITLRTGEPFAFAALWDVRNGANKEIIESFTIVTMPANAIASQIHDRMPLILTKDHEDVWIDTSKQKLPESVFQTYPSDNFHMYQVSSLVNSWKNDIPECILPVSPS